MAVMPNLISDYFCVATSGPTVDGREIRAQWIKDMAASYNVATYEAMMWYEHYRWAGNMGSVHSVKMEEGKNGEIKLFNRLIPSPELVEMNRAGQKLHTSIEVLTRFRGEEKAYQYGLAITDSPASIGTDRLSFSAGGIAITAEAQSGIDSICQHINHTRTADYKTRVPGVDQSELEVFMVEPFPDLEFKKQQTIFDFNFSGFFSRKNDEETTEGNDDMNQQETAALIDEKLNAFSDQLITTLTEKFSGTPAAPAPAAPVVAPVTPAVNHAATPAAPAPAAPVVAPVTPAVNHAATPAAPAPATPAVVPPADFSALAAKIDKIYNVLDNTPDGNGGRPEADGNNNDKPEF